MSDHVLDQLSAYLDDELVPLERATIDVHLASCAACARQLEEFAAVDRVARALPAEAPAQYFDDFASRVRARVQTKAVRRPWRLPVFTLAAAAGLALAVLTPMLLREKPSPRPAAEASAPARVADADQAAASLQEQAPPATIAPAAPKPQERLQAKAEPRSPSAVDSLGHTDARASGGAAGAPAFRDEGERRKDKGDEPRRNEPEPAAKRALAQGFAAAPEQKEELAKGVEAPAVPPAAAAVDQPAKKSREREADAGAAVGKLGVQRSAANAANAQAPGAEGRFRGLLAKKAGSAAEARALREDWRAFSEKALGAEADEARVRVIEAGVVAYGLGNDAQDLARLESDATAYLERPDAAQAARVQALLRSVGAKAP